MAEQFLTSTEVQKLLNINEAQLEDLISSGKLRRFLDQGVAKFRRSEVMKYMKDSGTDTTVLMEGVPTRAVKPAATKEEKSKLDLEEITAEPSADESDQTSVLPAAEDSDQTSMLPAAAEEGEAEAEAEEAVFDFKEDQIGLTLEEEPHEEKKEEEERAPTEVVAAEESSSASGVVAVAEEAKSDSSSDIPVAVVDESSSSDLKSQRAAGSDTDVVTDILEETPEDEGSEDLETVGLDDLVGEKETIAEAGGTDAVAPVTPAKEGSSAETAMLPSGTDEAETVGLAPEAETQDVGETLLTAAEEEIQEKEGTFTAPAGAVMVDYGPIQPSLVGNLMLFLALLILGFLGFLIVCDAGNINNVVTDWVKNAVLKSLSL